MIERLPFFLQLIDPNFNPGTQKRSSASSILKFDLTRGKLAFLENLTFLTEFFTTNLTNDRSSYVNSGRCTLQDNVKPSYVGKGYPTFLNGDFSETNRDIFPAALSIFGGFQFNRYKLNTDEIKVTCNAGSEEVKQSFGGDILTGIEIRYLLSGEVVYTDFSI